MTRAIFAIVSLGLLTVSTARADSWIIERVDDPSLRTFVAEERQLPAVPDANPLPDGLLAAGSPDGDIVRAWYADPTERYGHAILGDAIEAGTLVAEQADGTLVRYMLPETQVFEDRVPRIEDLDGDGRSEIVTIRASVYAGAAVTVYGIEGDRVVERASTPFIGIANRWLNIVGMADFAGTGDKQIAYVQTPHIGGTLFFFAFEEEALREIGRLSGFSNHIIGSPLMRLNAMLDVNRDDSVDVIVPSADRRRLRMIGFVDGAPRELASLDLPARIIEEIQISSGANADRDPALRIWLNDGETYTVRPAP